MSLVNVDPTNLNDGSPDPTLLRDYGIRGVRMVIRDRTDVLEYKRACQEAGLLALGIMTEQSGGFVAPDDPFDVVQIGNEPDLGGITNPYTPGMDIMGADAYRDYWTLYYTTWFAPGAPLEHVPLIAAGLASGQTAYWRVVRDHGSLPGVAGFAVHPYGKQAPNAQSLIKLYQALTPTLPCYVTEWHRPLAEIPVYAAMLRQTPGIAADAFFCWHDYDGFALTPHGARLLGMGT